MIKPFQIGLLFIILGIIGLAVTGYYYSNGIDKVEDELAELEHHRDITWANMERAHTAFSEAQNLRNTKVILKSLPENDYINEMIQMIETEINEKFLNALYFYSVEKDVNSGDWRNTTVEDLDSERLRLKKVSESYFNEVLNIINRKNSDLRRNKENRSKLILGFTIINLIGVAILEIDSYLSPKS